MSAFGASVLGIVDLLTSTSPGLGLMYGLFGFISGLFVAAFLGCLEEGEEWCGLDCNAFTFWLL